MNKHGVHSTFEMTQIHPYLIACMCIMVYSALYSTFCTFKLNSWCTSRLLDIINRFKLYEDLKGKLTTEQIVGRMREAIAGFVGD